jgi:hypothetical protein
LFVVVLALIATMVALTIYIVVDLPKQAVSENPPANDADSNCLERCNIHERACREQCKTFSDSKEIDRCYRELCDDLKNRCINKCG